MANENSFDLSKCAPLLIEQFCNDSSLQHVQVLLLGAIQDEVESGYPNGGMMTVLRTFLYWKATPFLGKLFWTENAESANFKRPLCGKGSFVVL